MQRGRAVDACARPPSVAAASRWEAEGRTSTGLGTPSAHCPRLTFFANQTPLAWVTHSRAWMPVSIQMAERLSPPVLNWTRRACTWSRLLKRQCAPGQATPALWVSQVEALIMGPSFRWGVGARGWAGGPQSLASCSQPKLGANVLGQISGRHPTPMPLPIQFSDRGH